MYIVQRKTGLLAAFKSDSQPGTPYCPLIDDCNSSRVSEYTLVVDCKLAEIKRITYGMFFQWFRYGNDLSYHVYTSDDPCRIEADKGKVLVVMTRSHCKTHEFVDKLTTEHAALKLPNKLEVVNRNRDTIRNMLETFVPKDSSEQPSTGPVIEMYCALFHRARGGFSYKQFNLPAAGKNYNEDVGRYKLIAY